MNTKMDMTDWAMVLATGIFFGSSFVFIKVAVESLPPITVAAGRALVAGVAIWAFLRLAGERLPRPGRDWGPLLVIGLLTGAIPYATIAVGQRFIDSGLAGILFGTFPVFTIFLSHFLIAGERLSADKLLGGFAGLAGVVIVVGPSALGGLGDQVVGQAVTLVAVLSYTLGVIYGRLRPRVTPRLQAAGQNLGGALFLVPPSLAIDAPWTFAPGADALWALLAMGILSTAIPSLLLFRLVSRVGATNASLATFFIPVAAVVIGWATLGERLHWTALAGLAVILAGAAIVNGRLRVFATAEAAG